LTVSCSFYAQGEGDLARIFWLKQPALYFQLVDRAIMMFSFYLGLWITNFNGTILKDSRGMCSFMCQFRNCSTIFDDHVHIPISFSATSVGISSTKVSHVGDALIIARIAVRRAVSVHHQVCSPSQGKWPQTSRHAIQQAFKLNLTHICINRDEWIQQALVVMDFDIIEETIELSETAHQLSLSVREMILDQLGRVGDPEVALRKLYDAVDVDNTDALGRADLQQFLEDLGLSFSRKKWDAIFYEMVRAREQHTLIHILYV
jgi:hypothetical protein